MNDALEFKRRTTHQELQFRRAADMSKADQVEDMLLELRHMICITLDKLEQRIERLEDYAETCNCMWDR